jgi:hypothetical protein
MHLVPQHGLCGVALQKEGRRYVSWCSATAVVGFAVYEIASRKKQKKSDVCLDP